MKHVRSFQQYERMSYSNYDGMTNESWEGIKFALSRIIPNKQKIADKIKALLGEDIVRLALEGDRKEAVNKIVGVLQRKYPDKFEAAMESLVNEYYDPAVGSTTGYGMPSTNDRWKKEKEEKEREEFRRKAKTIGGKAKDISVEVVKTAAQIVGRILGFAASAALAISGFVGLIAGFVSIANFDSPDPFSSIEKHDPMQLLFAAAGFIWCIIVVIGFNWFFSDRSSGEVRGSNYNRRPPY